MPLIITLPLLSIAETTKKKQNIHKYFLDYLSNESGRTIFLQPTDKEEIANIPLSIPIRLLQKPDLAQTVFLIYRILFLLKK